MALGTPKSAAETYQQVISAGGDTLYAQMAKLGLAEAQAQTGEYDAAINTFRELSQHKDGQLPIDGLLMRLGRTEAEAGKTVRRGADVQQAGGGVPRFLVRGRRQERTRPAEEGQLGRVRQAGARSRRPAAMHGIELRT